MFALSNHNQSKGSQNKVCFLFVLYVMQQLCLSKHKVLIPSDVWVDNLAHEQD